MDWVALHANPFWKEFWEDPEVKTLTEARVRTLIKARLEPDARARIGGQLEMLEFLPTYVEQKAKQQKEQEQQAKQRGAAVLQDRLRAGLPRIW